MSIQQTGLSLPPESRMALGPIEILRQGQGLSRHINGETPVAAPGYDLIFPAHGSLSFCQAGLTGEVGPGGYVLLRSDRFYELRAQGDLSQWRVRLPAAALEGRLVAVDTHVGGRFAPHPQMAALVARTFSATLQVFRQSPAPRPEALAGELVALIALMIGSEGEQEGNLGRTGRNRTRQRIVAHIERHLGDPGLAPEGIARAMGVSRSYLYALFAEGNETVAGFIRTRRLQAAYEMLLADSRGGLAISEVAYRTGFKSVSHFSRSFSRHFQATPRSVRAGQHAKGAQA